MNAQIQKKARELAENYFHEDGNAYVDLAFDALIDMNEWTEASLSEEKLGSIFRFIIGSLEDKGCSFYRTDLDEVLDELIKEYGYEPD